MTPRTRILVAIANHGTKNQAYVERLIREYQSMRHEVKIVVLSDVPKTFSGGVEVEVGLPTEDPWSLPFAHKDLFYRRAGDFDLFVYTEDDTLITEANVDAFLWATTVLAENEVAGFIRYEQDGEGNRSYPDIHGHFHWDPNRVRVRGGETFAYFSNEHAACFMLTQDQLNRALGSRGFLLGPRSGRYGTPETAATDPYTQCGFEKLVCVTRLADFTIPHLPNKYVGKLGVPESFLLAHTGLLARHAHSPPSPELVGETRLRRARWSKDYYEPADPIVLAGLPAGARNVLSLGAGWGVLESAIADRGACVTAIALNRVIADHLQHPRVTVLSGPLDPTLARLTEGAFDAVVISDLIHLLPDPTGVLWSVRPKLAVGGRLIATFPNFSRLRLRLRRLFDSAYATLGDFGKCGLHPTTPRAVRFWLKQAGFTSVRFTPAPEMPADEPLIALPFHSLRAPRYLVTAEAR